jgi:hypothetical protein
MAWVRHWRRRRYRRLFDWAEQCPELVERGGHVRLIASHSYRGTWRGEQDDG